MSFRPSLALTLLLSVALSTGCPPEEPDIKEDSAGDEAVDEDGDGYNTDEDCDDTNAEVYPGAEEICDEIDNDCNGEVDEGTDYTYYGDVDGDGYGDPLIVTTACALPSGYVENAEDCDDNDAMQYPGADEYCNDEDDDCDDEIDEDSVDAPTWYGDGDEDGYGGADITEITCDQPTDYTAKPEDCDDSDPLQYPGATELCNGEDDDCDGEIDEDDAEDVAVWYLDDDGDGFGDALNPDLDCDQPTGYVSDDTDCDDHDAAQYPGADEFCNGEDDDCDGEVDEDESLDVASWYVDTDGDGYGDRTVSDIDCDQPTGYVSDSTDCDDTDPLQFPRAREYCNGEDDDCDGTVDEDDAVDVATWYADVDSDGYGDPTNTDIDCDQPIGYVSDNTDCDDADAFQYPGAEEWCNGEDDDCDGIVDEDDSVDVSTWYADGDGDTYGDPGFSDVDCYQPTGHVSDNTDCDDTDAAQYPGADEYCNGEDDDCDGSTDEDEAVDVYTWYQDADGDSYGNASVDDIDCYQPSGYVSNAIDCDDGDAAQYPGADEYCNGEDDDCDGTVDEDDALDVATWYADIDADSYGDAGNTDIDCYQPTGYVSDDQDCDDADAAQYPGADEYCNGEDDDCDGDVDEDGEVLDGDTYYADDDSDSTGDPGSTVVACSLPSGYSDNDWDCDDSDASEPVVVDSSTGFSSGAGSMSSPLDTVQAGVDQAVLCAIVFAGTYNESVALVGMDIGLTGVEGADDTVIDATGLSEPAITVDSGETAATVISGFTLVGDGHVEISSTSYSCTSVITCTEWYYTYCGGGAYVSGSDPTFSEVKAVGSELPEAGVTVAYPDTTYIYSYGGGMCFLDSAATVSGSEVTYNYADQGGGVFADETSALDFSTSTIAGNSASDGGGFELEGGSLGSTNLVSMFNEADTEGGGFFLVDASATLVNTTHAGDDAPTGGGLWASGSSALTLMNGIVYGAVSGAGIAIDSSASFDGTYNNVYGNLSGNYSGVTDPTGSDGNISDTPLFIAYSNDGDVTNDDMQLNSSSPCVDAGNPSSSYDDADGTTNDMGAYGGPGSDW